MSNGEYVFSQMMSSALRHSKKEGLLLFTRVRMNVYYIITAANTLLLTLHMELRLQNLLTSQSETISNLQRHSTWHATAHDPGVNVWVGPWHEERIKTTKGFLPVQYAAAGAP